MFRKCVKSVFVVNYLCAFWKVIKNQLSTIEWFAWLACKARRSAWHITMAIFITVLMKFIFEILYYWIKLMRLVLRTGLKCITDGCEQKTPEWNLYQFTADTTNKIKLPILKKLYFISIVAALIILFQKFYELVDLNRLMWFTLH